MRTAYLAPRGFERHLAAEIQGVTEQYGRLLLTDRPVQPCRWAQNTWLDCQLTPVRSIGDAAAKLRAIQRSWAPYSFAHHRRLELIRQKMPRVRSQRLQFLADMPAAPLGSFTLLEPQLMLHSAQCTAPLPNGAFEFEEDKEAPPSRAYLKLWEVLTRLGRWPAAGEACLDLGASPGGWSWVLATQLDARVLAVDRAPLTDELMKHPNIQFKKGDAFQLEPCSTPCTWLFSDVICYPGKLYELVTRWKSESNNVNFVCTIKLQDDDEYDHWLEMFDKIPNSQIVHLYHNKHEMTWININH